VKLSKTDQDVLRSYRKRQLEEQAEQARAADCDDSGMIFATQTGRRMDRHNL
jgi:hypothetical protein